MLQGDIKQTLTRMTLPMMMGIVSLMLFNLADLYFVSRLGTEPLAALGFTFPVSFTLISLAIGWGIGTSATLARLMGAGDVSEAGSLASDNLLATTCLMIGISLFSQLWLEPLFRLLGAQNNLIPFILDYMHVWLFGVVFLVVNMVMNACMRATGDTRTPALIMAGSSLLNLLLDPLLIFGVGSFSGFGMKGAALASVISWALTTIVGLYILYKHKRLIVRQPFVFSRVVLHYRSVMKIGLPAALSNMMTPVSQAVLTYMVARHGQEAVAAFGVGNRIESLSLLICLALSMTLPPFISQNLGAGNIERISQAYRLVFRFAIAWQFLVFFALVLMAKGIAQQFSHNIEVQEGIILWIYIVPAGFAFQALIFLTASSFNALHQPYRAMRISIVRLFFFALPLAWIGSQLYGLHGMFMGLVAANFLVGTLALWQMKKYLLSL